MLQLAKRGSAQKERKRESKTAECIYGNERDVSAGSVYRGSPRCAHERVNGSESVAKSSLSIVERPRDINPVVYIDFNIGDKCLHWHADVCLLPTSNSVHTDALIGDR